MGCDATNGPRVADRGFAATLGRGLPPLGVALGALALYLPTLAPGLTWAHHGADGGDLIAAVATCGVPHPTGYPLYVLLGRLWRLLPWGTLAWRFSLFSAVAAALAAALVCQATRWTLRERPPALATAAGVLAGLACAAGRTLWSQAVITEVYALAAAALAGCLYLALRQDLAPLRGYWAGLGAAMGLSLGAHATLALALPALGVLLYPALRPLSGRSPWRRLVGLVAGLLAGLGVYAYLPLASRGLPPLDWGAPRTWQGFAWVVSGRLYQPYVLGLPWEEWPARLRALAALWGAEWGWAGLLLALTGAVALLERAPRVALAGALLVATCTLHAFAYNTADSFVYLIPAFLVASLCLGHGAAAVYAAVRVLASPRARRWATVGLAVALLAGATWTVRANWRAVDASRDEEAEAWLRQVAAQAPEGALVISGDDRHTFALAYLQWALGGRPDLVVVDADLWPYAWYADGVRRRWPGAPDLGQAPGLEALVAHGLQDRPVVLTTPREELAGWPLVASGALWGVSPPAVPRP